MCITLESKAVSLHAVGPFWSADHTLQFLGSLLAGMRACLSSLCCSCVFIVVMLLMRVLHRNGDARFDRRAELRRRRSERVDAARAGRLSRVLEVTPNRCRIIEDWHICQVSFGVMMCAWMCFNSMQIKPPIYNRMRAHSSLIGLCRYDMKGERGRLMLDGQTLLNLEVCACAFKRTRHVQNHTTTTCAVRVSFAFLSEKCLFTYPLKCWFVMRLTYAHTRAHTRMHTLRSNPY